MVVEKNLVLVNNSRTDLNINIEIGKVYYVVQSDNIFWLHDDNNKTWRFKESDFMTIDEYRDSKLSKLVS